MVKAPNRQLVFGSLVRSGRLVVICTRIRNIVRLGEVTLSRRVKLHRAYLGEAGLAVAELYSGGDEVLFGITSECQVQLVSGYEGAEIVAALSLDPEDGCLIRNTTQEPSLVLVDGAPVYSIFKLEDGDLLDIAGDQFRVLISRFFEQLAQFRLLPHADLQLRGSDCVFVLSEEPLQSLRFGEDEVRILHHG